MSGFRLTPEVFSILSALVEEHVGLHYVPADREIFGDKVALRAREAGFESALDYYYFLRYDARGREELASLVDALVVNETYFFREAEPLRVLVHDVLRPIFAAGGRARIWCAACATGEEPLTLAMILAENEWLARATIVASDVGTRVLRKAREGIYRGRSLRALPPGVAGRWLDVDGDLARVRPKIHDAIEWRNVNLIDRAAVAALGEFDAIVCRNVLIYFSDDTIVNVVASIARVLKPDGRLLVGASESLLRFGTVFECEERGGVFLYRKPRS